MFMVACNASVNSLFLLLFAI